MLCLSSSTTILETSAGAIALITNWAGSIDHKTISTLSPANSLVTAWTLEPLIPTHVPTGSSLWSFALTAIFDLKPGSLDAAIISSKPSSISGTSNSNNLIKNSGAILDKINWGPRTVSSILIRIALIRSLILRFSLGIICSRGKIASNLPISMIAFPLSILLICPDTSFSSCAKKSLRICSLSASLTFCKITCLAAWAPILPNSSEGIRFLITSFVAFPSALSSSRVISAFGFSIWSSGNIVKHL